MSEAAVREAFAAQAHWCRKLGSPFTAMLCEVIGERLDRSSMVGAKILDWPGDPAPGAGGLPLRVAGCLHALVLGNEAEHLHAQYPPNATPSEDSLWWAIKETFDSSRTTLLASLDNAPQTNEVGRSGPVMVGLLTIAAQTGLPLELFELGSSAGLNLNLARYAYDLGGVIAGDPTSAVRLAPGWSGPPPPQADVRVLSARGVDISPLSLDIADHRERLMGYVWPEQTERMDRLRAAIDIALAHPPQIDKSDAADWLEQVMTIEPKPGVVRVVYHTVAFQYFPADRQQRIRDHIAAVGAKATKEAPLAWLGYELDPKAADAVELRLSLWPNGDERVLGTGHPHGISFRHL